MLIFDLRSTTRAADCVAISALSSSAQVTLPLSHWLERVNANCYVYLKVVHLVEEQIQFQFEAN